MEGERSGMDTITRMELARFAQAARERQERIQKAWDAYHGNLPKPLKATKSDPRAEDNVRINLSRLVVEKSVSFLFGNQGNEVQFTVDRTPSSAAGLWLQRCLVENRKMTTLQRAGINGGVCGDVFLKLLPPKGTRKFPRIIVLDPQNVDVRWSPDDYEEPLSFFVTWSGVDPVRATPVAYRQVIERDGSDSPTWTITDQMSRGGNANWQDTTETEVWPYPWCPILHCQNMVSPNEYYGLSDLEAPVIEGNQAINFVVSNLNRIIRIHAHPKTWGKGFQAGKLEISADELIVLPDENGELHNLEMLSDLSSSLEHLRRLEDFFHETTRIPSVATGRVENLGQLSGLALKILYGPMVELTGTKRLVYGEMLRELCGRLLEMGGFGTEREIDILWPKILPVDQQAEAQTASVLEELGVSRNTLLTELGYDAEAEAEKKAGERDAETELGTGLLTQFERGQNRSPDAGAAREPHDVGSGTGE